MEKVIQKYQLRKLYEIQDATADPYRDCSQCHGYRKIIIMPNKWIQLFCYCNIDRYISVYECPQCYGTGKIKK